MPLTFVARAGIVGKLGVAAETAAEFQDIRAVVLLGVERLLPQSRQEPADAVAASVISGVSCLSFLGFGLTFGAVSFFVSPSAESSAASSAFTAGSFAFLAASVAFFAELGTAALSAVSEGFARRRHRPGSG